MTAASDASPEERIHAFVVAVDEEVMRPTKRYLRGFRRGLLLGCLVGVLVAPVAGRENRAKLARFVAIARRCRARRV